MTHRQRVLDAVNHKVPDRIPIDFWAVPEVFGQLRQALSLPDDEAVRARFDVDLRYFNGPALKSRPPADLPEGVVQDHWGVQRQRHTVSGQRRDGTEYSWTYGHLIRSPLAAATSVADVERHAWPTADLWDYSGVRAACQALKDAGYCVVAGADRLDRTAQLKPAMYLRGVETFLTDLALEESIAECILQHVADYYLEYNRRLFEAAGQIRGEGVSPLRREGILPSQMLSDPETAGETPATHKGGTPSPRSGPIDIFFMGDDMGTQASTYVSPDMYRRFFKKRLAAYCEQAHRYGMKTMYHTCGRVAPLVGDFIDAGLDILQSLQPQAMGEELAALKREYGRHLAFQGGIDIQGVLPRGTPDEVAEHVRSRAEILGEGGGYIFGTAHNILPDTPTENILALVEAYRRYGKYR